MNKCYYRIVWENYPSDKTPLNEQNLNKIDVAADEMDNRIISLDATKFDKSEAQMLVKYIEYDESTGIFKITHYNGASYTIDTLLEKLAINFDYDHITQQLIIELSDGEKKYVDLSALLTQYEFLNSDTVMFTVDKDGRVTADIIEGSIQEKHLRPNYLADIKVEAARAEASATNADASAKAAASSAAAAKSSETAAGASEKAAAASAQGAADSAATASEKAAAAEKSAGDASAYAASAKKSETNAGASETNAASSEESAALSAASAGSSATVAAEKSGEAQGYADMSKSYAVGTDGEVRPGDPTDNSKYYSEMAAVLIAEAQRLVDEATRIIAAASRGALIPGGTVSFENLPAEPETGYMYNISDDFTTDTRFAEGAGIFYRAGANVYWTADGKWDVLTGAAVTGVKGNAETSFRFGNVSITPANIGLGNVGNYKAVSTVASQGLSETEKANARTNIGAGTSSFSGSYNDLSDKPSIPTVGNGTVTIKQAGVSKGSFTMNQAGNATIELTDNNTTYGNATQSTAGLMSAADKAKLDGVAAGANAYSLPLATSSVRGGVKIGYSANGKNYPVQLSSEKMYVNVPWTDTDYKAAGGTVNGTVNAGGKASMWTDNEGGNFQLVSPDGTLWEIDAVDNNLRIFTYANSVRYGITIDKYGRLQFPNGVYSPKDTESIRFIGELNVNHAGMGLTTAGDFLVNNRLGDIYIRVKLGGAGVGIQDVNGAFKPVVASSFIVGSSRRYKDNILPMAEDRARRILDVEVATYDYKDGIMASDAQYDRSGVIAEDTADIIPEVVSYKEIDGERVPDSVDYSKFVPYLIRMVQLQQAQIDKLTARVDMLG